jgi:primosomal protein N' (replication factor Y)
VSGVKPLKLKREKVLPTQKVAQSLPIAKVLVNHGVLHLDSELDYLVPENLQDLARPGVLVEVVLGSQIVQGIVIERTAMSSTAGKLKFLTKVLSQLAYVQVTQLAKIREVADFYGIAPWEIISSVIPPFSKMGERNFLVSRGLEIAESIKPINLPDDLSAALNSSIQNSYAIELPPAFPYWQLVADIARLRSKSSPVLLLLANERELRLAERTLIDGGSTPLVLATSEGKSERYLKYLLAQSGRYSLILGTRSSSLIELPAGSTIIIQDDADEGFYERSAPTWNSRTLIQLRERELSAIYVGSSLSLEIANRVASKELRLYKFPHSAKFRVHNSSQEKRADYFDDIRKGLEKGSVLVSVGIPGYVTSFTCQRCRNIALCDCGGKLYFPKKGDNPICSVCSKERLGWRCNWCEGNKPRLLRSGVLRKAEEFGRAFPAYPVIVSSGSSPVSQLPEGRHLVLSTPGVEPRGIYEAVIFLDLEGRLGRTSLRASEELRLHLFRTLSMVKGSGSLYFALESSHNFLQSILRFSSLYSAERELVDRLDAHLPPNYCTFLLLGDSVSKARKLFEKSSQAELIGPFERQGRKALLLKCPSAMRDEVVGLLRSTNKVLSLRKEPLITFYCDPYSLN